MSNYVRRAVSGAKARFRDEDLGVELDLVYITDRIIIMGYPAEKWEALYRNDREDAKKFIEHRHGLNYWVFNLCEGLFACSSCTGSLKVAGHCRCPLKENSYLSSFFHDHVSRFPFPDHQ